MNEKDHATTRADDRVVNAILNAFYPQWISSATAVRARAQNAYTVASATAAALVAAGVLADVDSFGPWVQLAGGLALLAWIGTAALFMEVSRGVRPDLEKGGTSNEMVTPTEFAGRALKATGDEAKAIEARLDRAVRSARAALALTFIAFALALWLGPEPEQTSAVLALTSDGQQELANVCPMAEGTLSGELRVDTSDEAFLLIVAEAGECQAAAEQPVLVRASDVASVTTEDADFIWPSSG